MLFVGTINNMQIQCLVSRFGARGVIKSAVDKSHDTQVGQRQFILYRHKIITKFIISRIAYGFIMVIESN